MRVKDLHFSDQQLLLDLEGELPERDAKRLQTHIGGCWICRVRRKELENAIADYVGIYRREFDNILPPVAGPRALLKARLAELSSSAPGPSTTPKPPTEPGGGFNWSVPLRAHATAVILSGLLAASLFLAHPHIGGRAGPHAPDRVVSSPDSTLTPGAALLLSRQSVCAQVSMNNKTVPVALQRKVFEEYGIAGADPKAYEVDYLVTPALGGTDDIHNLWPHSYAATVWNARVKDALENRLREMVCDGAMDLDEAQREIAVDWIDSYKKHFRTARPLPEHCGQCPQ